MRAQAGQPCVGQRPVLPTVGQTEDTAALRPEPAQAFSDYADQQIDLPRAHLSLNGRKDSLTPPAGVERVRDQMTNYNGENSSADEAIAKVAKLAYDYYARLARSTDYVARVPLELLKNKQD